MTIERTVTIPENHRIILKIPENIPVGSIANLVLTWLPEKDTDSEGQQAANRIPVSKYFNIISQDTYGNGVVYQRKLREEWNE